MRTLAIVVGVLFLIPSVLMGGVGVLSESGEVVILQTLDSDGNHESTRLWVVDVDGVQWLRCGSGEAGWYHRLQANPQVTLKRGATSRPYTAVPVTTPEARDDIHARMRAKYGFRDRMLDLIREPSRSVAIRLDPR